MSYSTALISPRITVPCPILILSPMKTSPTMVALGAIKTSPILKGMSSYKSMTALDLEIVYENRLGASIALEQKERAKALEMIFNINCYDYIIEANLTYDDSNFANKEAF